MQLGVPIGEIATPPRPPNIDEVRSRLSQSGPVWTVQNGHVHWDCIAVFPILADPVDVKKGDQLCETVSQPSIQPDKMDRPMGS